MKKPALSEHVCGDRVLCCTGKKKKRGIKGSGSFTQVGREASLRDWFRHSKWRPGVILVFKALSCRKTAALTSRPTRLCDWSRRRYGCLLGADTESLLSHLGKAIPLPFRLIKMGWCFSPCLTRQECSWKSRRVEFLFLVLPSKGFSWLFGKTAGFKGKRDASSLNSVNHWYNIREKVGLV